MKLRYLSVFALMLLISSCDLQGVKKTDANELDSMIEEMMDYNNQGDKKDSSKNADESAKDKIIEEASDTLRLDNGIVITYFKKGTGSKLKKGDLVKIDYRMKLEDGKVYDGNHAVKKPFVPFLVGWNQQTSGWDIALKELRIGDDVDILLPAKYARGEAGIPGLVPPNSDNTLSIRIIDKYQPIKEGDGIQIYKYDEKRNPGDSIGFEDEVYLNYWVSSESNPRYDNSYQRGETFKMVMGDGNVVPGLYKALYYGREGDRLMIKIPAKEAYGKKGLHDLVKPNEDVFYDIQIAKVIKKK